jgi:hypothetical protein
MYSNTKARRKDPIKNEAENKAIPNGACGPNNSLYRGTIAEKYVGGKGDAKCGNMPIFHEGGFYMKEIAEHSYWL